MSTASEYIESVLEGLKVRNPGELEFQEAVVGVLDSLAPVLEQHPEYQEAAILERIVEPERAVHFRVPWVDDEGKTHVNRGYRFQFIL